MFGFGLIVGKLNKRFARQLLKVSSIIIFVLGISMLGNGLLVGRTG